MENAGHGVDIYIFDSGVRITHKYFKDGNIRHFRNKDPSPYVPDEPAVRITFVLAYAQPH